MKQAEYNEYLTNEMLHRRFKSQFDLVRYAIKLAVQKVVDEQALPYIEAESENIPAETLFDIAEGCDELRPRQEIAAEVDEVIVTETRPKKCKLKKT